LKGAPSQKTLAGIAAGFLRQTAGAAAPQLGALELARFGT